MHSHMEVMWCFQEKYFSQPIGREESEIKLFFPFGLLHTMINLKK